MVAARIPSCSVSVMTRSTNFSLVAAEGAVAGAVLVAGATGETLGLGTEPDDVAGELAAALAPADGDSLEALGAELLPEFVARPAACLHRSDRESLCSLRQVTILPPPGWTPAHSFRALSAQALRIASSDGWPPAWAAEMETEEIVKDNSRHDACANRLTFIATSLEWRANHNGGGSCGTGGGSVEPNSTPCCSGSHPTEFPSPENHACALEQARSQDEMTECFRISVNRSTTRRLGALWADSWQA